MGYESQERNRARGIRKAVYGLREPKEKMAEKFYALKKNLYWRYNPYSIIRTKSSFYY
ncbi:hypothetical protein [Capnocytophaga leadbetteri]|uniref:hypothetical protein n=1 Tax=Capnocytophaga leadbetteri TaxID=327575 RepID=UPI001473A569|nr:hypothetical protein [Capnocytophaga leadbetteri]